MAAAAKWASFIVSQVVCIIHKCAFSWPTNLINVQWANFSYLIMILSIFSHGSEKKLVGVLRGLTNQPYVRRSTCDTPLIPEIQTERLFPLHFAPHSYSNNHSCLEPDRSNAHLTHLWAPVFVCFGHSGVSCRRRSATLASAERVLGTVDGDTVFGIGLVMPFSA